MSQLDLQALSEKCSSLQRQLTHSSQHAAGQRENFSERLTRLEGSQRDLTDQDKRIRKNSDYVEKLKKVAFHLQKESAQLRVELGQLQKESSLQRVEIDQLRAIVARLTSKDQKLTDQKSSKD
jgi:uncharacterized protein (UPF0335 family)